MEKKNNNYAIGMSVISSIFFIFGFATTFIITLSSKVKDIFTLSEFEAQLLTGAFFITYLFLSVPSGLVIKKIGYKKALIIGLLLMALGSFLFFPAAKIPSFALFLSATFILAAGVVFLQTSANPYVAALGSEESASGRLNLTQALNSIATMVAPWIISVFIFKGAGEMLDAAKSAESVQMPFIIIGIIVLIVAGAILAIKLPEIKSEEVKVEVGGQVWKYPHVLLGAIGIFFYVGAEVGNAGLLVNYLIETTKETIKLTKEDASTYAAIYWGGAMIGRFFGSIMLSGIQNPIKKYSFVGIVLVLALLSGSFVTNWNWEMGAIFLGIACVNFLIMQFGKGNAGRTLAVFALVAALCALTTAITTGQVAIWTLLSIGLFNSVMFPNIFSLAVKDLKPSELSVASGIINTLIFGGAIVPVLMGAIADVAGYSLAFVLPALCYLYIFYFAVKGSKIRSNKAQAVA